MSLVTFVGPRPNLLGIDATSPQARLEAHASHSHQREIWSASATSGCSPLGAFKSKELDHQCIRPAGARKALKPPSPARATHGGQHQAHYNILILSDRWWPTELPIPGGAGHPAVHINIWSRPACASPVSSLKPGRRVGYITSRCSAAMAPRPSTRISRRETITHLGDIVPQISKYEARSDSSAGLGKASTRSCRRWAFRRTRAIAVQFSSRSVSTQRSISTSNSAVGRHRHLRGRRGADAHPSGCVRQ